MCRCVDVCGCVRVQGKKAFCQGGACFVYTMASDTQKSCNNATLIKDKHTLMHTQRLKHAHFDIILFIYVFHRQ